MGQFIGRPITVIKRSDVEEKDTLIKAAGRKKIALITAGVQWPLQRTLRSALKPMRKGIATSLVHGVSIFTAAATSFGLQPYKFGRTVTIPFPEPNFRPTSPYENILENSSRGLHTLILLDIKEEEGRYMTANIAMQCLMDLEKEIGKGLVNDDTLFCAGARIGSRSERLYAGWPKDIVLSDIGPPLHCMVLPGKLHFIEAQALVELAGAPKEILSRND